MAGALSTLGLGSQGVLTNDLLDKLKDADKTATINPIERKQESAKLQQAGLVGLKDAISKLSDLSTSLSDLSLYQSKTSSVTGDAVSVEASASAQSQTINLEVESLATRDIQYSYKKFASKDELFGAGDMTLEIDGNSYTINITDTDTVEDVTKKISESTDGKIQSSLLNVGGDEPFRMLLKSTDTGAKNAISITSDISFRYPPDGEASDAQIRIDGIIARSDSNEFNDLVEGVKIKIDKVGESTIEIKQDSTKIMETMESFVSQYNELLDSVKTLTNYDSDTKVAGVFQGTSEIKNMLSPLKDIFSSTISATGKMAEDFGLSADRSGHLTLDKDKFSNALKDDTQGLQNFFIGEGESKGIFRKMNTELFEIGTSSDGVLKTLKSNYDDRDKSLLESLEKAQARLDNKYDIMQKKFASYDAVIGRLSNASNTLTALIDADSGKK
jgi:flagellar hook-associated protein 2